MTLSEDGQVVEGARVELELPELFAPAVGKGTDGLPELRLLIDGRWVGAASGETFPVHTPIDGSRIASAARAGSEDVEAAVAAARAARDGFRAVPASERLATCERAAELVAEHLDAFVHAIVVNLGKTPTQARSEAGATKERLELAREEVRKIFGEYLSGDWIPDTKGKSAVVLHEPLGTVAAIGPFNYPLFLAASKIIPALAAGNTVVAKAPSDDPVPLVMLACVLEAAGLPAGVLNVVTGSGAEIGDLLAAHSDVSMISFTGSTAVGRRIAELAGPKPLHLELGGNATAIVLADADLERAVEKSVMGAFKNAGQRCDAISRVLVEDSLYDEFVQAALEEARSWTLGDPRAEGVKVGPLINARAIENVERLVGDAVEKGAQLLLGGQADATYFQPTVLADVPLDADIVWEETFGPVVPVMRVADLDDAIAIANRSRYGLDSAVFTEGPRQGLAGRTGARVRHGAQERRPRSRCRPLPVRRPQAGHRA